MDLKGKTVIVTGGAKRVGKTIALTLAHRGANIAITYRQSEAEARETTQEIEKLGVRALALKADISRAVEVDAAISQTVQVLGRLDVLVNNAAVFIKTPFATLTEAQWDIHLDTNLKGVFLCSQRAAREILKQGGGKIINVADWAGLRPYVDYLPYCVSKAGVIALTKALARELAPSIQVNCVAPGPILLPPDLSPEEYAEVLTQTPLKRVGSPQDIANTLLFLCEGSDFITGAVIPVDGGRLIA